MSKKLILASAGAGKTYKIVEESIEQIKQGDKVLVVTYTENNQKEIINKFKELNGRCSDQFHVKGLFTFLLDDLIRPYQSCLFDGRIESINFNEKHPHKISKMGRSVWIKGRQEKNIDGSYNPLCYLTNDNKKAHTLFLAKLATLIIKKSKGKTIERLEEIYNHIYFDEVQDLVGWDYDVIDAVRKSKNLSLTCVGDFRQTIYKTSSFGTKPPKNNSEKINRFRKMSFSESPMSISRRSIQCICDFADKIHVDENYEKTESLVKEIPQVLEEHIGIFIVKETDTVRYISKYNPIFLRHSAVSGKQFNEISVTKINFGKSKGLGFDRVLILPTNKYVKYLMGDTKVFEEDDTDEPKNKLYVAITRARYSVGFIMKDVDADKCNLPIWEDY